MFQGQTDKDWEFYGKHDPYFGVVTWEKFKSDSLNDASKKEFFETGAKYMRSVIDVVEENFCPNFHPQKALDFGCGVGRLVIPLASISDSVTGVDVSSSMLKEARENCAAQNVDNATFVQGDDTLSEVSGTFDFINSFVVFQHIPTARGEKIAERLVSLLNPGGIGALHFSYARGAGWQQNTKYRLYKTFPFLWSLKNTIKGSQKRPMMQVNLYDLNKLFYLLQSQGCQKVVTRFTCHSGKTNGVTLYFQK